MGGFNRELVNNPKISILVPVYKVEQYLKRCLDSVIRQSFTDWEMILVDDGSPDNCPEICDSYANKDSRIKVVHKSNGGLISARKAGYEHSSAEWIMFLDSDDWLTDDAMEFLYGHTDENTDVIRGGFTNSDGAGNDTKEDNYPFEEGEITDNSVYMRRLYLQEVAPYLWGALYRRSLFSLKIFNIGIEEHISFGEDIVTNLLAGVNVRKARYFTHQVYHYFKNPHSMVLPWQCHPYINSA